MSKKNKSTRILSIDALRGFDMFWISGGDVFFISLFTFINTPFSKMLAGQLDHSPWSGFTFYDFIFPLFLFIVGLNMPFSITKRLERGDSKKTLYKHIIRRTIILYALGLINNGFFNLDFHNLRYTGVLHRIAFCYFFASIIMINFKPKALLIWAGAITLGYWLILLFVPTPGFGAYNLTPQGNLCGFIDRQYLPRSFCCYTLGDNEGIISNFAAIASVLMGVFAGNLLMSIKTHTEKIKHFILIGLSLIACSLLWNFIFPINKIIWTGSYVMLTTGLSFLIFCLFYWIIDVKGYTKWAFPFTVIGMNSITIYVVQVLFDFGIIAKIFIHGFYTQMGGFQMPFLFLCTLIVKWLFLYFLYKQKLFLKV